MFVLFVSQIADLPQIGKRKEPHTGMRHGTRTAKHIRFIKDS